MNTKNNKERKEVKVWKVLQKYNRESCAGFIELDQLLCTLRYPVGEFVSPKIPSSKIFCFKEKKYAQKFIKDSIPCALSLHRAIAINPQPLYKMCLFVRKEDIVMFWGEGVKFRSNTPEGTYGCDELKCLD